MERFYQKLVSALPGSVDVTKKSKFLHNGRLPISISVAPSGRHLAIKKYKINRRWWWIIFLSISHNIYKFMLKNGSQYQHQTSYWTQTHEEMHGRTFRNTTHLTRYYIPERPVGHKRASNFIFITFHAPCEYNTKKVVNPKFPKKLPYQYVCSENTKFVTINILCSYQLSTLKQESES